MDNDPRVRDARRDRNSLKARLLFALGITSTHAARRSTFFNDGTRKNRPIIAGRPFAGLFLAEAGLHQIFDLRNDLISVRPFGDEV